MFTIALFIACTAIVGILVYWIVVRPKRRPTVHVDAAHAEEATSCVEASASPSKNATSLPCISPDELDAREVDKLARLASRKSNRQRLFVAASTIREACNLSGATVIDKEDARLLREFNDQLCSMKVPSSVSTKPTAMSTATVLPSTAVALLPRFDVISLGNMGDAPVITDRQAPGEERPRKMMVGPVRVDVPLPNPVLDVQCVFASRGFDLTVTEGCGRRRRLKVTNLEREIDTVTSSWSLSANKKKVKLELQKADLTLTWYNVQGDMQRATQEALKEANKQLEKDPMGAMTRVIDEFCSALPPPSSREAEENIASGLHQRVMMGIGAALEKTQREVENMAAADNQNVM